MIANIYKNPNSNQIGYKRSDGVFVPVNFERNNLFKLPSKIRVSIDAELGKIVLIQRNDKVTVYQFFPKEVQAEKMPPNPPAPPTKFHLVYINDTGWFLEGPQNQFFPFKFPESKVINTGNASGGGGSARGVYVQDEGTQVNGLIKTLNFIGSGVAVADAGGGKVNITISGGISGSGTVDRVARWTPDGSTLGNSIIRDNGTVAAVNRAIVAASMFSIQGADAANVNYTFQTYNSTPTLTFGIRNDAHVGAGVIATGNLSIGFNSGAVVGTNNTAVGIAVMSVLTIGTNNVGVGTNSLNLLTTGINNTAVGFNALASSTIGSLNVAIGSGAGSAIVDGSRNNLMGQNAGASMSNDFGHVAVGWSALATQSGVGSTAEGVQNVAIGYLTLNSNTVGLANTAVGANALLTNTTGTTNTALGAIAGFTGNGSNNVFLGWGSGYFETGSSKLFIDNAKRASEADGRIKALVYGKFGATTAVQVFNVNANLGIGIGDGAFGASADFVLGIKNGTAPTTSPADLTQIYSADIEGVAGAAGFHLRTEGDWINVIGQYYHSGSPSVDGSWRWGISGDNFIFQQREAGVWNTKLTILGV